MNSQRQRDKAEAQRREQLLQRSLVGRKVRLRCVEANDLPLRVQWVNSPVIQRTLNFQYPLSLAKMQKWLDTVITDNTRRDFSIVTTDANAVYIGFGGFLNIDHGPRKAELYVAIGNSSYWGKGGYGIDAYRVLMRYGFLELGLNRIYGYQLTFNSSARRVVEMLGWQTEGTLRQDIFAHGELRDRAVVSILREEWVDPDVLPSADAMPPD